MHRRYALILLVAFVGQFLNVAHFASTLHVRTASGAVEHVSAGGCGCGQHHHEPRRDHDDHEAPDGPILDGTSVSSGSGHHCSTPTLSIAHAARTSALARVDRLTTRPTPRPAFAAHAGGIPTFRTAPKQSPPHA